MGQNWLGHVSRDFGNVCLVFVILATSVWCCLFAKFQRQPLKLTASFGSILGYWTVHLETSIRGRATHSLHIKSYNLYLEYISPRFLFIAKHDCLRGGAYEDPHLPSWCHCRRAEDENHGRLFETPPKRETVVRHRRRPVKIYAKSTSAGLR